MVRSTIINRLIDISDLPHDTILTPHEYEFAKLFDIKLSDFQSDRISIIKNIIPQLAGRILILKGPTNIIVTSKGEMLLVNNGNKLLATAGTGDVLSGIIAGLVVQGVPMDKAAILSTYLHAECANIYSKRICKYGLISSELIDMIPKSDTAT